MKKLLTILLLLIITIISCKKDKPDTPVDLGYSYLPNNIGHWVIYQVDSTVWDGNFIPPHIDTFHYKIKEYVESTFSDNSGRTTQRLERYIKLCDACNWEIKDVWYLNLTPSTAEKIEENERFIKLIFPVKLNAIWKGNAYNTWADWDYEYVSVNEPAQINSLSFDSTLTVMQNHDSTLIYSDYSVESYAKNVGMIYKNFYHFDLDPASSTTSIKNGVQYSYKVISWGN
ncbi:MAG: hypothetical protein PHD97_03605 [Bacteroidales bacterium]|nr:hypothetical protein [Bacteroidales bacterium]